MRALDLLTVVSVLGGWPAGAAAALIYCIGAADT